MVPHCVVVAGLALLLGASAAAAATPTAPKRVWYRAELRWEYGETLRASGSGEQQTSATTRLALTLRSPAPALFLRTCTPDPSARPRRPKLPGSRCPSGAIAGYRERLAYASAVGGAFGADAVRQLVETRRSYRTGEAQPCATLVTTTSQILGAAATSGIEAGTDAAGGYIDWGLVLVGGRVRSDARLLPGATCPARAGRPGVVERDGTPVPDALLARPGLRVWQGRPRGAAIRPTRRQARLVMGARFGAVRRYVWAGRQAEGVLTALVQRVEIVLVPCGSGRRPGRCAR